MVRVGRLLPGATIVNEGIFKTVSGIALLDDKSEVQVFAKPVNDDEVLGEIFCALLCNESGLLAPEPLLLFDEHDKTHFGSIGMPHPSCAKMFKIPGLATFEQIKPWLDFLAAFKPSRHILAFDEWINNRDRNPGNLLWISEGSLALIDHNISLNINPSYEDKNCIAFYLMAHAAGTQSQIDKDRRYSISFAKKFDIQKCKNVKMKMSNLNVDDVVDQFTQFVTNRHGKLKQLITYRLPPAQPELKL